MTILPNDGQLFSPFIPSTFNIPEEGDRLKVFLVDRFSILSDVVNDKKIGNYTQNVVNYSGNKLTYDTNAKTRSGFQYLIRILSYPAGGVLTFSPPPNLNSQFVVFQVWGSASKPPSAPGAGDGDYFSFYGSGNPKITFTFTDTVITVTTAGLGIGYSGFIVVDFIYDGA